MSEHTVPRLQSTPEKMLTDLDSMIEYWRTEKKLATEQSDLSRIQMSRNYIDAYQSVRKSFFGEVKPL